MAPTPGVAWESFELEEASGPEGVHSGAKEASGAANAKGAFDLVRKKPVISATLKDFKHLAAEGEQPFLDSTAASQCS